jgi:SAM-dependent methyltransferase
MTGARITAGDNHPPFVGQIQSKIDRLGLGSRVTAQVADMNDLPFPDGSFDVIWSEGSIFIIGFARGLSAWRRLLAPGGHMVVSDFCWFRDNPPAELKEMFIEGCPDAGNAAIMQKAVAENGYELIGEFTLPETGWWENYLVPLDKCLKRFREAHAGDPEALAVADRSGHEIELYKRHPGVYGYEFFVMRRG